MIHESNPVVKKTVDYLKGKSNILFLTTSNRYDKENDQPKSTALAYNIAAQIRLLSSATVSVIEIPQLKIYPCEGNVSSKGGNNCGVIGSTLQDKVKNPTGNIRCWAAYNNQDDEIYKVANAIFDADVVVFFASVRWGQANSFYQKLIERLNWIENRRTTLQQGDVIKGKEAGFICIGQNWNDSVVCNTQKKVLGYYGFRTPQQLFWCWQYTSDADDESASSYKKAIPAFEKTFKIDMAYFLKKLGDFRSLFARK